MKKTASPPLEGLWDVVIVGGGPAGLSAALLLGRCLRRVLVVDGARPRNEHASAIRGFLTREGTPPRTFLRIAREELRPYRSVRVLRGLGEGARRLAKGLFEVRLEDGRRLRGRAVLLATGVVDRARDVPGLAECFGRSVFPCPYCDAFELRGRPLGAWGRMPGAAAAALGLRSWTDDVVLLADGDALPRAQAPLLRAMGVRVERGRVVALEHRRGRLRAVRLEDGRSVERRALFLAGGQRKRIGLARDLGCRFTEHDAIDVDEGHATCTAGVYAAGDVTPDSQFVVVAAAEGARAAVSIHEHLAREERDRSRRGDAAPS